jgi:hypothetical protein
VNDNVEPPHDDDEGQVRPDRGGWVSGPALPEHDVRLAELRAAHPDWLIWWGKFTESWWAAPPPSLMYALINDADPDRLEAAILDIEAGQGGWNV